MDRLKVSLTERQTVRNGIHSQVRISIDAIEPLWIIIIIVSLIGGMQDYNYVHGSCMEITLELSCCKYPPRNQLPEFWRKNRKALLAYLNEVHQGIRGIITDTGGSPIADAILKIEGRDIPFKSSKRGEFWRILLPGSYVLHVQAIGYQPIKRSFVVQPGHQITYLDIELTSSLRPQVR